jgi:hypothetical protein
MRVVTFVGVDYDGRIDAAVAHAEAKFDAWCATHLGAEILYGQTQSGCGDDGAYHTISVWYAAQRRMGIMKEPTNV